MASSSIRYSLESLVLHVERLIEMTAASDMRCDPVWMQFTAHPKKDYETGNADATQITEQPAFMMQHHLHGSFEGISFCLACKGACCNNLTI